jgi:hypothetical protein
VRRANVNLFDYCPMRCDFEPTGEMDEQGWQKWKCSRCERLTGFTPHDAARIHATCRVPGWGDYVAWGISRYLGITKDDVKKWVGWCPCEQNQNLLNRLGHWAAKSLNRLSL